jgi:glycosyltransferase involved in cell wall biosynthesis
MKRKKAALYDPFLDTFGGGEKHVLSILQALEQNSFDIYIFWNQDVNLEIKEKFNIHFNKHLIFLPNIFTHTSFFKKMDVLSEFDIFIYVTDGSYFFSRAKKNYIFCMTPDKKLYSRTFYNRLKTNHFTFIANSKFTQQNLRQWKISSNLLYPYIDPEFINFDIRPVKKENVILSTGRFFKHLHSKRQDITIQFFKKLKQNKLFQNYKLILTGGLKEEDKEYVSFLNGLIGKDPSISLEINISHKSLVDLYKKARFYWHCAGYDIDDKKRPELVEHLGISPLEAMAMGCITYCYNAGGPKEIISIGNNGFLFQNSEELFKQMKLVINNPLMETNIKLEAKRFVKNNFSYKVFETKVKQLFL